MTTAMTGVIREGRRLVNRLRLRQLREEAELTRNELAKLAGTRYDHIYRMESGERGCTAETLRTIADVLAESLDRSVGDILTDLTNPE